MRQTKEKKSYAHKQIALDINMMVVFLLYEINTDFYLSMDYWLNTEFDLSVDQ